MSSTKVPAGVVKAVYWTCPGASRAASLGVKCWMKARASRPWIMISPIWLTSKSPARVRTARCSAMTPLYSTGISQPKNSMILAPALLWNSYKRVLFMMASLFDA